MNREKTATFIGHKDCYGLDEKRVLIELYGLIAEGVNVFLCGGMGDFDMMCARLLSELKKNNPELSCHLVIPYLTFNIRGREYFDEIIYPEGFEKYHFKSAIPARNKYLIDNSSSALCYVTHDWGGAAKTFALAKKAGLNIINLGDQS